MSSQEEIEYFEARVEALMREREYAEAAGDYDFAEILSEQIEAYTDTIDQFLEEQGFVESE